MSDYPRASQTVPTLNLSTAKDPGYPDAESSTPPPQMTGASEMARFRELLLGQDLREVERRLRALEAQQAESLERLRVEQQAHFEEVESLMRGELARLSRAQRRDREERSASVQQLSERLEALAKQLMQALNKGLESAKGELSSETRARESALLAQASALESALDARLQSLETELEQEREHLRQVKADRDELSRLFSEVAQRLNRQLELPPPERIANSPGLF